MQPIAVEYACLFPRIRAFPGSLLSNGSQTRPLALGSATQIACNFKALAFE